MEQDQFAYQKPQCPVTLSTAQDFIGAGRDLTCGSLGRLMKGEYET
jgi:hypothetical protein